MRVRLEFCFLFFLLLFHEVSVKSRCSDEHSAAGPRNSFLMSGKFVTAHLDLIRLH